MPPIPPPGPLPRVVTYFQTVHTKADKPISILPVVTQAGIAVTHVILAAIHINEDPQSITLNDHHPSHPRYQTLWAELRVLQASGVKVMGMLGGAAKGSYTRLDGSEEQFERYWGPVRDMVRERGLEGLDLDVEEEMSLAGIVRLIDRIRADFGPDFIISMAPVAAALIDYTKNLSGFDYEALEVMRGRDIAWYNAQFYWGWGKIDDTFMYDMMMRKGWPPEKVVVGVVTNPNNGGGYVPPDVLAGVLMTLNGRYQRFGGVMGWEFFNSLPGGAERPWEWAVQMMMLLRGRLVQPSVEVGPEAEVKIEMSYVEVDPDEGEDQAPLQVPSRFDYFSDGSSE